MASVRVFFLMTACVILINEQASKAMVVTGVCAGDSECIESRGTGFCCAPFNPNSAMRVCKPPGQAGELCHVASNIMPYPWNGGRRFWRCACAEGTICVPNHPGAKLGTCA
ncbi:PROK2 [Branchiostoma lanceolatum]|uniref:PROK2 protein n=1 Tax=Branchiostoma lanceolatum TaxID=7740 RepID=A0A8K0EXV8_BRALA|nr:PROK2 [Branchiostoma lanceolatum]